MVENAVSTPHAKLRQSPAFWPVFAWLGIQMLALLAAGLRVPFSARFPTPEEQFAMHEMMVAQMMASALLFPVLFRNVVTSVMVIVSAPVLMQLAGAMGAVVEFERLIVIPTYSSLWLVGLALWSFALRREKARLYAVATATMLVAGGAILAYLHREFGAATGSFDWSRQGYMGPLIGGMAIIEAGNWTRSAWMFMGVFLLSGIIAAGIGSARNRAVMPAAAASTANDHGRFT